MSQTLPPFAEPVILCGAYRSPRQMLADQTYGGHLSIHDDATAESLGLRAGPIEGPTHFSQFVPLLHSLFGDAWFETGCISSHFQNMVVEGEEVRAFAQLESAGRARIWAEKRDGVPVLTGTATVGSDGPPTEIGARLAALRPPERLVILRDLKPGQKSESSPLVSMDFDQHMGPGYPFTLNQKLKVITEPSPWYDAATGSGSPWGAPVIPLEMVSVLFESSRAPTGFDIKGPSIGLFADFEVRMIKGPLLVGRSYRLEREIVALSESRRTESYWIRTRAFDAETGESVAEMILNHAIMKASYAPYKAELAALG